MPVAVDVWARTFLLFFLYTLVNDIENKKGTNINKKSLMMITDYAKINLVKEFIETKLEE